MSILRSLVFCVVVTSLWACSDSAPPVRGGGGGDETSSGSAGDLGGQNGGSTTSGSGGSSAGGGGSSLTGGSDATVHDASSGTDTGAGSRGPCGALGIFACDDFETTASSAKPDVTKWSIAGNPNITPIVDDKKAHSGTHSLDFAMTDNQGVFISPTKGFPPPDNSFYVRVWVNLGKPMKDMGGHVDFIVGATAPENGTEVRLGASQTFGSGVEMLDLNLLGGNNPEHSQFSNGDYTGGNGSTKPGVTLDAGRWYCLEGFFNGKAHEFQLWVDDVEVPALHVTDWGQKTMSWSPMYKVGKVGAQKFSGDPGQLSYDDVAFGTSRIGCN